MKVREGQCVMTIRVDKELRQELGEKLALRRARLGSWYSLNSLISDILNQSVGRRTLAESAAQLEDVFTPRKTL